MQSKYPSIVSLNDMKVSMSIGLSDDERSEKQDIILSFKLFYTTPPKACETDEIEDTNCYYKIYQIADNYCSNNSVKLLEYLCYQLYKLIRNVTDDDIKIWVKAEKCRPPIDNFAGTSSFEFSDNQ